MDAQATVTHQLDEDNPLLTHPPVVEAHRQADGSEGPEGQKWHAEGVKELLLGVGEKSQERVGVFGEVVRSV